MLHDFLSRFSFVLLFRGLLFRRHIEYLRKFTRCQKISLHNFLTHPIHLMYIQEIILSDKKLNFLFTFL